jgi:hypothetical protein
MPDVVGPIVMTVNGTPIANLKDISHRTSSGKKAVKGMTPHGRPLGVRKGTKSYSLNANAYLLTAGRVLDWDSLEGAVVTIMPRDGVGQMIIFRGVYVEEAEESYSEDGDAMLKLTMGALDKRQQVLT